MAMLRYSAKPPTIAPTGFAPNTPEGYAVRLNVLEPKSLRDLRFVVKGHFREPR
jgi:hypothetical protein